MKQRKFVWHDGSGPLRCDFTKHVSIRMKFRFLPDDILTKVDRAGMAVWLEARVPLLDPEVVELAWSRPRNLKLHEDDSKWLLRRVLHRHVPKALVERPKMGFGVPIGDWLRMELRDWAEDLLDHRKLDGDGIFKAAPVRQMWDTHISGQRNMQYPFGSF